MDERTLDNMRSRVAKCRQLAKSTTDARTAKILQQMADEGEADIRRLEDEQDLLERSAFEASESHHPTVN